jgi:hypothetical protein
VNRLKDAINTYFFPLVEEQGISLCRVLQSASVPLSTISPQDLGVASQDFTFFFKELSPRSAKNDYNFNGT